MNINITLYIYICTHIYYIIKSHSFHPTAVSQCLIALKALAPLRLDALGATAHGDHSAAELALEAPQAHPLTVERLLEAMMWMLWSVLWTRML